MYTEWLQTYHCLSYRSVVDLPLLELHICTLSGLLAIDFAGKFMPQITDMSTDRELFENIILVTDS